MAALKNSRNIALSGASSRVDSGTVTLSTGGIAAIVFPPNSTIPTPSSITITATAKLYSNPTYVWEYRYGTSGGWTAITNTTNILTVSLDPAWVTAAGSNVVVQYRLTVSQTGYNTVQEILSLPLLRSAVSSVVIDLSNDSTTIATNTDGSGGSYTRATTTLSIFSGTTDVIGNLTNLIVTPSTGVTFSFTKNGVTTSGNTTAQTISLSPAITSFSVAVTAIATAQDGGTLTISATYNGVVYIAVYSVTKGKAGENALVYEIEADSQISLNTNTNTFSPATVTYSAYSITGTAARTAFSTGTITLESSTNGNTWTAISSAVGATATLTTSNLANTIRFVRAKLLVGAALVDQETDAITVSGTNGTAATNNGNAQLYQWASAQPGDPSGNSTWTWATGVNSNYTGGNGWQTTIPTNPQTPGIKLWVAAKQITAQAGTATSSVDWSTGFSIYVSSLNGLNGLQSAEPTVYQWALSTPTISGTSLYTWSSDTFTINLIVGSWASTPGSSPSVGYTLWAAKVKLVASASETQSTVNWTNASISAVGYAGTNGTPGTQGASSRLAFARIANNPTPTQTTVEVNGDNLPSSGDWGLTATWSTSDPTPTSTNTLYQADGIYNPVTNKTVWSAPYISSLKVGLLSAITVNTGALTVQDRLTVGNTGSIAGGQTGFNTGTGFFIGYSDGAYKLSVGDPAGNRLSWNGSGLTIIGSITTGSIINGAVTLSSGTALSTVESNASSALSGLANKLDKQSTYILGSTSGTNEISLKTSGYDGGNGIIITNTGILGKQGNQTTFAIDNTGTATFKGDISGSGGNFIGTLTVGSGNTVFKVNNDGSIQSGNATFSSAPFRVTNTGALTATSATITGTLAAGSVITNTVTLSGTGTSLATIEGNASSALSGLSSRLQANSSYTLTGVVAVDTTGGLQAGNVTWNSTTGVVTGGTGVVFTKNGITGVNAGDITFSITNEGNASFKGNITGSTGTFNGMLAVGTGNTIFKVNSDGSIQSGNATFSSAPFRVTSTGDLTATSATITGTLAAGSVITNTVTLSGTGTSLATVEINASNAAANAAAALAQVSNKLQASSSYILTGVVSVENTGGIQAGSVTWNSTTGAVTGGTGVVFTERGITGVNAGETTFSITNEGNATFKGNITGSTGDFAGRIVSGSTSTNGVVISPDGIKVIVNGVVRVRIGNLSNW